MSITQALERELAPVEERLAKLEQMAHKVVKTNTSEGREVNKRKEEINALWDKLKVCTYLYACLWSDIKDTAQALRSIKAWAMCTRALKSKHEGFS